MDFTAYTQIAFYVATAAATIFMVEAIYLAIARPIGRKRGVNRRLKALDDGVTGEQALLIMKAERGILSDFQPAGWLRRLLIQSGLRITVGRFLLVMFGLSITVFSVLRFFFLLPTHYSLAAALVVGVVIPIIVVKFIRSRRQTAFSMQLPDALDVVVRSLRSGHPVPVALAMVAREMADPVGTEFGLTIDEMTYGLDMPRALVNLADRVGVADLSLLVTAVSLQTTAGGNLSEVLGNLSKVLRDRFQLRRKIRALSSEGRFSAWGLSILPIMIFLAIFLQTPTYYTDIWDEPIFKPAMLGLILWTFVGDFIMYKMINFKY